MSEKLYVLGHPVSHSKSPVMYNAVYKKAGLDWHYGLMDVPTVPEAEAFLAARDFLSINITTPYKPEAFAAADVWAASAMLAHGANVLVNKDGALIAYNTDGQGCVAYLERAGVDFRGTSVVVCGTGPTSLSILHAVAQAGPDEVILIGREAASGTRDGFESITGTKDKCQYRQELTSTGDVITAVSQNPDAIGYASLASIKDTVKALNVDGVTPGEATVKDGSYKVQRPFVLVTVDGKALSPAAQAFFDYATSSDAASIIAKAGAVAVAG